MSTFHREMQTPQDDTAASDVASEDMDISDEPVTVGVLSDLSASQDVLPGSSRQHDEIMDASSPPSLQASNILERPSTSQCEMAIMWELQSEGGTDDGRGGPPILRSVPSEDT
ncbi:uncharacterized protein LOC144128184 [Amblyomma americanum]